MTKHKITAGETLSSIAKRYNTTVDAIAGANGILNKNLIYAGTTLNIPTSGSTGNLSVSGSSKKTSTTTNNGDGTVTVTNTLPLTGAMITTKKPASTQTQEASKPASTETKKPQAPAESVPVPETEAVKEPSKAEVYLEKNKAPKQLVDSLSALNDVKAWKEDRPKAPKAEYSDDIRKLVATLTGMDFSYDPTTDPAYKLMRDENRRNARLAMEDTLGKALSMTGGYSNTYASGAAQQAYGRELSKNLDIIPELYSAAYDRFSDERDYLGESIELLSKLDDGEFEKYNTLLKQYLSEGDMLLDNYKWASEEEYDRFLDYVELLHKVTQ